MKNIFISMMILIFVQSTLLAKSLSDGDVSMYDSEYFQKIQLKNDLFEGVDNLSVDVTSLENNNFELKLLVNKHFKPFVIVGAKVSELLSSFNLDDFNRAIGANIHISESFSYYAKYTSSIVEHETLLIINSSATYVGIEYSF